MRGPVDEINGCSPRLRLGGKLCDDFDDPVGRCESEWPPQHSNSLPMLLQKRMGQWPASAMACTAKYTAEIDNALNQRLELVVQHQINLFEDTVISI